MRVGDKVFIIKDYNGFREGEITIIAQIKKNIFFSNRYIFYLRDSSCPNCIRVCDDKYFKV